MLRQKPISSKVPSRETLQGSLSSEVSGCMMLEKLVLYTPVVVNSYFFFGLSCG